MISMAKQARERIKGICVGGVILAVFGAVIALAAHPRTSAPHGVLEHHGSRGGYAFGLVLSGVGSTMVWVALIAWAVMLGIQATRD
jgi:hypothetical protein